MRMVPVHHRLRCVQIGGPPRGQGQPPGGRPEGGPPWTKLTGPGEPPSSSTRRHPSATRVPLLTSNNIGVGREGYSGGIARPREERGHLCGKWTRRVGHNLSFMISPYTITEEGPESPLASGRGSMALSPCGRCCSVLFRSYQNGELFAVWGGSGSRRSRVPELRRSTSSARRARRLADSSIYARARCRTGHGRCGIFIIHQLATGQRLCRTKHGAG